MIIKVVEDDGCGVGRVVRGEVKLVTVYRAKVHDNGNIRSWQNGFYRTKSEARKASDYPDHPYLNIAEVRCLETEEGLYLLDGPYQYSIDLAKKIADARAKLTAEERTLLGIK